MKKLSILLLIIVLAFVFCSYASKRNERLSQSYTLTLGEWLAYRLSETIRADWKLDAPFLVSYDKKTEKIVLKVYGGRPAVEGAKESLQNYRNQPLVRHMTDVETNYGIVPEMNDYVIIYLYRFAKGSPREIIRMEEGKLLLP